jgi:hypothetical protein
MAPMTRVRRSEAASAATTVFSAGRGPEAHPVTTARSDKTTGRRHLLIII